MRYYSKVEKNKLAKKCNEERNIREKIATDFRKCHSFLGNNIRMRE